MNILRKELAPISADAWDEINEEANEIFNAVLSARKFVDVDGPKGLDFGAVHTGRIDTASKKKDTVQYGLNQVLPLVESRSSFSLDIWELDNIARGAKDADLSNMEEAARDIASFEEKAIYHGLEKAGIDGLKHCSDYDSVAMPEHSTELLNALSTQLTVFRRNGIDGPFSLVVNEDSWERLTSQVNCYPLRKQFKDMLKGSLILSPFIEEAFLVADRGEDFSLTLGQDLSIGYNYHDKDEVELFFTESFTFQCHEPAAVMVLEQPNE